MKLALVVHDFDPHFGQGRYCVELARRLAPAHDVHIYANRFGVPLEANWTFQRVPAWRATALTTILTFIRQAEKLLRRRRYDLIHAQGLSCWRADVITAHICNAARARRAGHPGGRHRFFSPIVVPMERRFYRQPHARQLIAVSRRVEAEVVAEYAWQRPRTVIYHGTDTDRFSPPTEGEKRQARAAYDLAETATAWLFAGEAVKGLSRVIDQLTDFPEASLLVVSRSNLDPFRHRARTLGVNPRIRFFGPEPNMPAAYHAADVLVYPSDYDAFGLVVAEAMAAGLPVVVGQQTGVAEWIVPRQNGLLCDPASPASLRTQLEWLQAEPARSRNLGRAARATVLEHTWDACATATTAVYQKLLAARSADS
jgi:UDP-glucose:(heptosyl)LPS alpha-1,3-glucosyltransferase